MAKVIIIVLVIIISVKILSCSFWQKDEFYTNKNGWDYSRIPLLKPYELTNTDRENWLFAFKTGNYISDYCIRINGINVLDSIIITYTKANSKTNDDPDSSWSFVVTSKRVGYKFSDKKVFLDSLSHYTPKVPTFRNVEDVWKQFDNSGYLEWFPKEY